MSDVAPRNETAEKSPKLPAVVAGLIVIAGVAWYFWVKSDWEHAGTWGAIGDAVGPFAGLATALALGFAVYATLLQREELKLQRDEMRAQREEMALQRAEAAKAAAAQERLATSQERLAEAQEDANELQRQAMQAQREEMKLQREEATKSADAQVRLAESQALLADAQKDANRLAKENTKAQKSNTMAVAAAALGQIEVTLVSAPAAGPEYEKKVRLATLNTAGILRGILANDGDWRTRDDAPKAEKQ